MNGKTCEICGDVVERPSEAKCGHPTDLCEACKRECPGALEMCLQCEGGIE